jgi:hypothetical protein
MLRWEILTRAPEKAMEFRMKTAEGELLLRGSMFASVEEKMRHWSESRERISIQTSLFSI